MLTEAQVAARANGIGASESVILFPQIPNSYCTPYKLWMLKTSRLKADFELNDYQWWGHELEPAIAKRYEYETGEKLEHRPETFIHEKLPYMLCHPDRFVHGKRILVEIKTAQYSPEEWGEPGTDHVPPAYVIQVQHQLAVTGYDEVHLIVFFMNYRQSRIYIIKRDDQLIAAIENAVSNFWNNHVIADVAPALTCIADCKLKFPKNHLASFVEATSQIIDFIDALKIIKSSIKAEQVNEEAMLAELFAFIGDSSGIKQDDKILATWKARKDGARVFRLSER